MNITKENIDALNAVVKVDIVAGDYQEKVTEYSGLRDLGQARPLPGRTYACCPALLLHNHRFCCMRCPCLLRRCVVVSTHMTGVCSAYVTFALRETTIKLFQTQR